MTSEESFYTGMLISSIYWQHLVALYKQNDTMQNSIFITYNPSSENEKNIALDLFRKGRQNGYFIYLPERNYFNRLTQQTKSNIDSSNWFVIFSTSPLSDMVRDEIEYAFKSKNDNQIIVIYSKHFGKNHDFPDKLNLIEIVQLMNYDLNSIEKI